MLERHIDFLLTAIIILTLAGLASLDLINLTSFSPALAAAIFTVVIGASVSLLTVLSSYDDVVSNAKDGDMMGLLRRVFYWPIIVSVAGFVLAIIASIVTIPDKLDNSVYIFSIGEYLTLTFAALLIYSILSFREVFRTVYYIMVYSND